MGRLEPWDDIIPTQKQFMTLLGNKEIRKNKQIKGQHNVIQC